MNKTHLMPFAEAMARGDLDAAFEHVSDTVVLRSPMFEDPFEGKEAVRHVMEAVGAITKSNIRTGVAEGPDRVVIFNTRSIADVSAETMDIVQVDEEGRINAITVMWRPLRALIAGHNLLAGPLGRDRVI